MLSRISGLFVCCVLAACTTPEDLMQGPPDLTLQIKASPEEARDCFTDPHPGRLAVVPKKDGWLVMAQVIGPSGPQDTAWVVQIEKTSTGSNLIVHYKAMFARSYRAEVKPCLDKLSHS